MYVQLDDAVPAPPTGSMRSQVPGTIIEAYIRLFGGRYGTASIVAGAVLYLVGYVIAVVIGFTEAYEASYQVQLGAFGVTWVTWWVAWSTRRMRVLTERIQPIFLGPPERFHSEVARFEKWVFNWRLQFRIALVLWILGCLEIYLRSRNDLLFAMPPEWSQGPYLLGKNLILFLYDLPIVILFTVSGIGLISFVRFVRNVSQLPLLPYLTLVRLKLRGLTDFSLITGLAWSVGICLVVLLFNLQFRAPAIAGVLLYTTLGLAILLVPESTVHNALERIRHDVLDEAIRRLETPARPQREAAWLAVMGRSPDPERAFSRAVEEALTASTWTYNLSGVSSVLGTWLLPLVPLLWNSLVRPPAP